MRPQEVNFSLFPTVLQAEGYLGSLPGWKCEKCSVDVHPVMRVAYRLAREAWPLCIPCYETSIGRHVHGINMNELGKSASQFSTAVNK